MGRSMSVGNAEREIERVKRKMMHVPFLISPTDGSTAQKGGRQPCPQPKTKPNFLVGFVGWVMVMIALGCG